MKVRKLTLDESLFDDEFPIHNRASVNNNLDDDFSEYEEHSIDNVVPGPRAGADTGAASELIRLINDEWEAIEGYNNAIATLRSLEEQNPFYSDAIKVLEEISAEENVHVGQLQEVLRRISPNAQEIHKGTKEAANQLKLNGGLLPVQSWDDYNRANAPAITDCVDDTCTLIDIDDEM